MLKVGAFYVVLSEQQDAIVASGEIRDSIDAYLLVSLDNCGPVSEQLVTVKELHESRTFFFGNSAARDAFLQYRSLCAPPAAPIELIDDEPAHTPATDPSFAETMAAALRKANEISTDAAKMQPSADPSPVMRNDVAPGMERDDGVNDDIDEANLQATLQALANAGKIDKVNNLLGAIVYFSTAKRIAGRIGYSYDVTSGKFLPALTC